MGRWRRVGTVTVWVVAVLLLSVSITAAPMAYTALRNRGIHGVLTITQVDCTPDRCDYRGIWRADLPYERVVDDVLLEDGPRNLRPGSVTPAIYLDEVEPAVVYPGSESLSWLAVLVVPGAVVVVVGLGLAIVHEWREEQRLAALNRWYRPRRARAN